MSSYHQAVCDVIGKLDLFFEKYYSSINLCGPELDATQYQRHPLMFACTHRSHMDYILVGYKLHKKGFKNMRFAAGDNLTKLPYVGPRFTSLGAFTVSRDNGFERNYVRKLCDSVICMLDRGEPIIVFPEGGRSYSGVMLELKNGILGAAVLAQARDLDRDVYVVPIAVSYDLIPDLPYFNLLQKGKLLKKKSNPFVKRIIGSMFYFGADLFAYLPLFLNKAGKKKFGNVYIDYKAPISVRSIVDVEKNRNEKARDDFSAHRVSMQQLSTYLHKEFHYLYRILPVHLVSFLLKNGNDTVEKMETQIESLIERLRENNRNAEMVSKIKPAETVKQGLDILVKQKAISVKAEIIIRKQFIIDYYSAAV